MKSGIYIIRNKVTGKVYLGSSVDVAKRLARHKADLKKNVHPNEYMGRAYLKDGDAAFSFEVLMLCRPEERLQIEQSYIDHFRSTDPKYGYNLIDTRESQLYGEGISKFQKIGWGKISKETRIEMASHLQTKESRAKCNDALKIVRSTPEYLSIRKEIALKTFNRADVKEKLSEGMKKRWQDPEFRAARLKGLDIGREKTNAARRKPR